MRTVLSFGGGVQTTAILSLVKQGELPQPDAVVMADTGCEWPETYDYLARYTRPLLEELGVPFMVVKHLSETLMGYYLARGWTPRVNLRDCTKNFKVSPLSKWFGKEPSIEWIGFSLDEQGRAARKRERPLRKTVAPAFPLIDLRLTRSDCAYEIERFGWPVPRKSSCICCPFQHPSRIAKLSREHPDLFEQVVRLEENAGERRPGWTIIEGHPWRTLAQPQMQLDGDWDYGCGEGYCLR